MTQAVEALAALAQEHRLEIFRALVRAGHDGMAAGQIADLLDLAPNNLTFHLDRLRHAGLVTVRREGRSMIYSARYETMNALIAFLRENCCRGRVRGGAPAETPTSAAPARRHKAGVA